MPRHAVLIGLMGSGKTSVGEIVARRTGRELLDTDALLQQRTGATAAEIARREGIDKLHRLEGEVLRSALANREPAVITAPASVADDLEALHLLAEHHVVWTHAPLDVLAERVRDPSHRPLVDDAPEAVLRDQAERRAGRYAALADVIVDTGVLTAEQAATTALKHGPAVTGN